MLHLQFPPSSIENKKKDKLHNVQHEILWVFFILRELILAISGSGTFICCQLGSNAATALKREIFIDLYILFSPDDMVLEQQPRFAGIRKIWHLVYKI